MKAAALHILVKNRHECEALKVKLAKGAHFGELARRHSLCPSGKKGALFPLRVGGNLYLQ